MKTAELIKTARQCGQRTKDCKGCPLDGREDCLQYLAGLMADKLEMAVEDLNKQQVIITNISKLIVDNTYPYFDKDGKPVIIWNADGYRMIEQRLKEMAGDRDE